jgi:hypothetical protein
VLKRKIPVINHKEISHGDVAWIHMAGLIQKGWQFLTCRKFVAEKKILFRNVNLSRPTAQRPSHAILLPGEIYFQNHDSRYVN